MAKMYSLTIRNRAAATVLGIGIISLGAVLLAFGLALVLGLVVAGGVVAAGIAGLRLIRGGGAKDAARVGQASQAIRLDPALEVKAIVPPVVRPRGEID